MPGLVSCTCAQGTMVEGTSKMQIQPKGDLLPEAIFTGCQHNVTMATTLIGKIQFKLSVSTVLSLQNGSYRQHVYLK